MSKLTIKELGNEIGRIWTHFTNEVTGTAPSAARFRRDAKEILMTSVVVDILLLIGLIPILGGKEDLLIQLFLGALWASIWAIMPNILFKEFHLKHSPRQVPLTRRLDVCLTYNAWRLIRHSNPYPRHL